MVPIRKSIRRLRFFLLEKLVLPLAIVPFRAWIWTWRKHGPDPATTVEIAKLPRVIMVLSHSELPRALGFAPLWQPYGRRWVVLTTPSLDGRLAAAMLAYFGAAHVPLRRGTRGVEAAVDFIRRVEAGDVGVILVDGPRGPRGIVKPGVARTVAAARARVVAGATAATPAVTLPSWDRPQLPAFFARVHASCVLLPEPPAGQEHTTTEIQEAMVDAAREAAQRLVLPGPSSP